MKRSSYDNSFKAKVAIEAIKGDKTYEEIASTFGIAKSLITKWRDELLKNSALAFNKDANSKNNEAVEQKLYQQIGQLTMEVNFLKKFASKYNLL
jgi:transposase